MLCEKRLACTPPEPPRGDLLGKHHVHQEVGRRAAVLLRESEAEQAGGGGLLVEFAWKLARLIPGRRMRHDFALDEAPDCVAPGLVLLGQCGMGLHTTSNSSNRLPGATWAPALT